MSEHRSPTPRGSRWVSLLLVPLLILVGISTGMAAPPPPEPKFHMAPLRPGALEPPPPGAGFVPPPMDLSHLTGQKLPRSATAVQLPSAFSWLDKEGTNYVTPVKNQGTCGSCYTFASIGNIESKLLIDGAGTWDFSENNAKECNWYDTSCGGGNYMKMANLFSKKGVVLESCDPYVTSDVTCTTTCAYQKTLLDWRIIAGDAVPNTTVLKQYIYDHGPVFTVMYAGTEAPPDAWYTELAAYDGSYALHYTGTEAPNHAVLIVGWDDSLAHTGGTGAWIVKNSWGTGWGASGYFAIAYGSASIGKDSSFMYDWQDHDPNGDVWYYDEGGWTSNWGGSSTTLWGLAGFTHVVSTSVKRVEFWTTDATTDVDVYLYDDFDGSTVSNLLASKLNSSFDEAGYHSVALDSPVFVGASDDVYAVVKFTNQGYVYPIPIDIFGPSSRNTAYSATGAAGTWAEVEDSGNYYDVAIRLRTSTSVDPAPTVTSILPSTGVNTETVSITALVGTDFQAGASVKLTRSGQSDVDAINETVVNSTTITCDLALNGVADGQWNVMVINPDSQFGILPDGFTVLPGVHFVFLPLVMKDWPSTDLYVQNNLGTVLHLTINGVGTHDVPTGLYHWGIFPAGTYFWSGTAAGYNPFSDTTTFPPGTITWTFSPALGAPASGAELGQISERVVAAPPC